MFVVGKCFTSISCAWLGEMWPSLACYPDVEVVVLLSAKHFTALKSFWSLKLIFLFVIIILWWCQLDVAYLTHSLPLCPMLALLPLPKRQKLKYFTLETEEVSVFKNVDNRKVGVSRSGLRRGGNERWELEIRSGRDLSPVLMSPSFLCCHRDLITGICKFWEKSKLIGFFRFQI